MNVVADALSKNSGHTLALIIEQVYIHTGMERAWIVVLMRVVKPQLARLTEQPTLRQRIAK